MVGYLGKQSSFCATYSLHFQAHGCSSPVANSLVNDAFYSDACNENNSSYNTAIPIENVAKKDYLWQVPKVQDKERA
jgi:hypothetical protein